jgi:hypothetical protein
MTIFSCIKRERQDCYNKQVEPISKRLKSVTLAKADTQKRTENTGYRYGCAWRLGKQHCVSGFRRNYNNRLLKLAQLVFPLTQCIEARNTITKKQTMMIGKTL